MSNPPGSRCIDFGRGMIHGLEKGRGDMSDLYRLTDAQMAGLAPFFPKPHGKAGVNDRRILSGMIFINRDGLRWSDAPEACGPHN